MDANAEVYVERLIEASREKYKCLQDMLLLTMAQYESINEDRLEGLQKLVSDKQIKIDEINKIDEEFGVYFSRLKQKLGVNGLDEVVMPELKGVDELKQIIKQIVELLSEIQENEQKNNEKARNLLNGLGENIRKIRDGRKLSSVYNSGADLRPPSYFVDKRK